MSFRIEQKSLERLEWPTVLGRLAACARTPQARARCEPEADPSALFATSAAAARGLLAETEEARAILAAGDRPPLDGAAALENALHRAGVGGVLSPRELLDVAATAHAVRATTRFLHLRRDGAPRLAERAARSPDLAVLAADIDAALEPSGEVRDAASPVLAAARADGRRLASEIQGRLDRLLRDPGTISKLSDTYYTVRNDRYVLPVRADARGSVRGIVHDASNTGTTVFIEPEALVGLNNRRKHAEIEVQQETLRVLRELSATVAGAADDIREGLRVLEDVDFAFARAGLADEMDATAPTIGDDGVVILPQLRHPLIDPSEVVPNDVRLGDAFTVLVLSGPNAGGKTVTMKAVALAALLARAGIPVPAGEGARLDAFDAVLVHIGDEQNIRESLSTFSAHMRGLATIVDAASPRALILLDEVGVGTDPGEGAALAQATLEALADAGARVIATTHYNLLKEMADVDRRFANASVEFDPDTLAPTFRLRMGTPGSSSARAVAVRMGMHADVIERANRLLEHEDRQLDRMLAELSASRAALEREQSEAARARAETESARSDYRRKLEVLQQRREKLYATMREDLDRTFRDAHEQVAAVIRDLQRGGTAQDAARARAKLQKIEADRRAKERDADLAPAPDENFEPIDWRRARPGDPVRIRGGGSGVLEALPDHRGRAAVRVGSARALVAADRVGPAGGPREKRRPLRSVRPPTLVRESRPAQGDVGMTDRIDLHGMHVEEALERVVYALDRAAVAGHARLVIVHGIGTGALRDAIRRHLAQSPYVTRFAPGTPEEGGDGATTAELLD